MITFADFVTLADENDPIRRIYKSASAFLSLSGFNALIVTSASPNTNRHQVLFTSGYTPECVEHVCSRYVVNDPHYSRIKLSTRPLGWHSGFDQGFEAKTWLLPAGYRNGSSVSLQDQTGREIGSIHMNTRLESLSDQQFEAIESLKSFLCSTLDAQLKIDRIGLTQREIEVIRYIVQGASNPEIAEALYISRSTVATHIENVLRKLGAHSRVEIAVTALRLGIA